MTGVFKLKRSTDENMQLGTNEQRTILNPKRKNYDGDLYVKVPQNTNGPFSRINALGFSEFSI